jgi:hypothetical protein
MKKTSFNKKVIKMMRSAQQATHFCCIKWQQERNRCPASNAKKNSRLVSHFILGAWGATTTHQQPATHCLLQHPGWSTRSWAAAAPNPA